jgi:glycosyltransferase involved in cell wall biosynthesis
MKISVALCTYNGKKFLREQLNSILNQTHTVNEVIICDDNSSDGTISIIESFQNQYPDIIYLHQNIPGLGTIKNFEKAISLTTGDLIFLSDQDDIWLPEKVSKTIHFFKHNIKCMLLFSNGLLIDESGNEIGGTLWDKWHFDEAKKNQWKNNKLAFTDLINGNNKITGATVCFNKNLKERIFPFDLPLGYWHDGLLGLHSAAVDSLFFIEESLIKYRVHAKQQVGISSDVISEITLNSNKSFISKQAYFRRIKNKYPNLKEQIPYQREKNIPERILIKIRKVFNL